MLILGRTVGERIMIGDNIIVTVSSVVKGLVKLGIEAPRNIEVHREEVFDRIKNNNILNEYDENTGE
jgi:carbon storage regulator